MQTENSMISLSTQMEEQAGKDRQRNFLSASLAHILSY